jgi:AcrR family transcriptional regulator
LTDRSVINLVMSPRTVKQFETIRESRKALIMEKALELFVAKGFHAASISDIARQAGISKGLMYNYFKSKEVLIKEIAVKGMREFIDIFDPNRDGVLTDEEFEYFINESFRIVRENTNFWKLYFTIMLQPPVYEMVKEEVMGPMFELLQILVDYYKRKELADPGTEAILFGALMDGIAMNYILDPDHFPLEEVRKGVLRKFSFKDDM